MLPKEGKKSPADEQPKVIDRRKSAARNSYKSSIAYEVIKLNLPYVHCAVQPHSYWPSPDTAHRYNARRQKDGCD